MVTVGRDYGLDLGPHRATPLDMTDQPDLVYAMERHHIEAASIRFPALADHRIRLLDPNGVDDPYGLGMDRYVATAHAIAEAIDAVDIKDLSSF